LFQSSSASRRDSTPLLDKVKMDSSLVAKAKAAIEAEKEDKKQKQPRKPTEDLPIIRYLDTQACTFAHIYLINIE